MIINNALSLIKELYEEDLGIDGNIARESYLKTYRTVQLTLPRDHGNTTLASKIYKKYKNEGVLYVSISASHCMFFEELFPKNETINTCTYDHIDHINKSFKIIIVDPSQCISQASFDNIYSHAVNFGTDFVIKLG